jgi:ribosomal protein S18 acetylase RimI-like enzyme
MATELLRRIDGYMDAVPRAAARAEDIGPIRLFVKNVAQGWPYYARPIAGEGPATAADIARVRERQRELDLPEAFEWIEETVPTFADEARAAGLEVVRHPLLTLDVDGLRTVDPPLGAVVRMALPDDDHRLLAGVAMAGFDVPGTQVADRPYADVETMAATVPQDTNDYKRWRLENGVTFPALAEIDGRVVAVGYHQPVDLMTEIVGVATLPAYRRRGLAAAVTSALTIHAFSVGVTTAVLSAGDDDIARIYERVGFRRVGSAGGAEPPT